jgi:hypothetical protein
MAAPTGSFLYTKSPIIQEIINKGIEIAMPTMSPIWKRVVAGNAAAIEKSQFGRDLVVIKTFQQGLAGVFEDGGARLDSTLYGDPLNLNLGDKLFMQGNGFGFSAQGWPDPLQGPNPRPFRLRVHMRSMVSNLAWTLGELDAEALPAYLGEVIAPKLAAHSALISHRLCTQWFLNQNTNFRLCTCHYVSGSITIAYDAGNQELTFYTSNLSINRFHVGQRVQFWVSNSRALADLKTYDGSVATSPLDPDSCFIVTKIDELTNKVSVRHWKNQVIAQSGAGANQNFPTAASYAGAMEVSFFGVAGQSSTPNASSTNNYTTGIAGLYSWMKVGDTSGTTQTTNNTLLGLEADASTGPDGATQAINVNSHPEFKSMSVDMSNQPLTEHTLRKIVRRWHMARGKYGQEIDLFMASDGVWLAYEGTKIGQYEIHREGRLSSLNKEGSEEGFTFSFDGKTYNGETDSYMESNTVLGIKTRGGNWKKYVPPSGHGRRWDKAPAGVPFELVASSMTGLPSNQLPIFRTGNNNDAVQLTEFVQMPGRLRMQLVPDQPTGLIISNVAEDRLAYA